MACGTPVIAYRGGGALETVLEGTTGEFFDEPSVPSLAAAMDRRESRDVDPAICRSRAEEFSAERFKENITEALSRLLEAE